MEEIGAFSFAIDVGSLFARDAVAVDSTLA